MFYRIVGIVLGCILWVSVGVFATGSDCESTPCPEEIPNGKQSCIGSNLTVLQTIDYYGEIGEVGKNNGDYCMWYSSGEIQMGCDYIGVGTPHDAYDFTQEDFCCGIKLNTDVPFVGRCINQIASLDGNTQASTATAFPRLMRAFANIVMTLILVGSIILLVVSGVMWTSGDPEQGKRMIRRVIFSLVLLGASGIILRLINPVFFG